MTVDGHFSSKMDFIKEWFVGTYLQRKLVSGRKNTLLNDFNSKILDSPEKVNILPLHVDVNKKKKTTLWR